MVRKFGLKQLGCGEGGGLRPRGQQGPQRGGDTSGKPSRAQVWAWEATGPVSGLEAFVAAARGPGREVWTQPHGLSNLGLSPPSPGPSGDAGSQGEF